MDNKDYARVLKEITSLMKIRGDNHFRTRAFENAARTIETQGESIENLIDRDELTKLKGIGDSIAQQIHQLRERGTCELHEDLVEELDPGLLRLLKIQGLGPKRIKLIYDELDIATPEALREAAEAGKIQKLSGLGAKTEQRILSEIARLAEAGDRIPLPRARSIAESVRDQLADVEGVIQIEIAGSLRRGRETIGDIDLMVAAAPPEPVHGAFRSLVEVSEVLVTGETKTSVRLHNGIQVDLRTVEPHLFGSALHYFTGSKEHHVALRTRAKRRGLKISEYGVFKQGEPTPIASRSEEDLYDVLDLEFIPPELREGHDEIERAADHDLPTLVEDDDVRGDLHMHTTETDGRASIEEMAQTGLELGYEFIAITDHSQAVRVANGMTAQRFSDHIEQIRRADEQIDGIRILAGIEVDILKDGSLDMDHDLLAACDWVVASVHSYFRLPSAEMTNRIVTAVQTGLISALGHPTGRILGGRDGYEYDFDTVVDCAIENHVALEINGSSGRLDLNATLAARAHRRGAMIVLGSDAHSQRGLQDLSFAIQQARRAGLEADAILNCRPSDSLLDSVRRSIA